MPLYNPDCLGNYDFDNIARFAKLRFIEGHNTIDLLQQATTEREKEEIALVAMLDLDDLSIENIKLHCKHADKCHVTNCRKVIKELIEKEVAA